MIQNNTAQYVQRRQYSCDLKRRVEKQAGESVWVKITQTQFTTAGNADCQGVYDKLESWVKNNDLG